MFNTGETHSDNNVAAIKVKRRATRNQKASLTDVEMAVLSALLFDKPTNNGMENNDGYAVVDDAGRNAKESNITISSASSDLEAPTAKEQKELGMLNNDMMLYVPADGINNPNVIPLRVPRGLMKSLAEGLWPPSQKAESVKFDDNIFDELEENDSLTAPYSWKSEEDGAFELNNNWEVLIDESVSEHDDVDDRSEPRLFRILGTNEADSIPPVLTLPLMESLLRSVPDSLAGDNFWLKYSLIRDGASLDTLKRYVRAAENSILAIEDTKGQVFGSFTSSAWRNHRGFYGSGPAFLWRMRPNQSPPHNSSLNQAQMESEIDVFAQCGCNDLVQVCDENRIAIGGGKLVPNDVSKHDLSHSAAYCDYDQNMGFGICINEDLSSGTSSPCGTFRNPCLSKDSEKGEVFDIANLEVWTFTSCFDVKSAEQLEMTKFFMSKSLKSNSSRFGKQQSPGFSFDNAVNAQDLFQKGFYRRVGQSDEN